MWIDYFMMGVGLFGVLAMFIGGENERKDT